MLRCECLGWSQKKKIGGKNNWYIDRNIIDNNFEIVIHDILTRKYKYSSKEILENIITFNEINEVRIGLLNKIFNGHVNKLNITSLDFLEYPEDKKYHLQIANPPYA